MIFLDYSFELADYDFPNSIDQSIISPVEIYDYSEIHSKKNLSEAKAIARAWKMNDLKNNPNTSGNKYDET